MPRADKGMGGNAVGQQGAKHAHDVKKDQLTEADLAQDKMGQNKLAGNDQHSVRNQRHSQAEAKKQPDDVIESFEKLDKNTRAERDLGKGNRTSD